MLRSAPLRDAARGGSSGLGARLEARTASLQPLFHSASNFLTASFAGTTREKRIADAASLSHEANWVTPAKAGAQCQPPGLNRGDQTTCGSCWIPAFRGNDEV